MPRMRTENESYAKAWWGEKIPIAGNREAVQAEVPQAEIYAQLLDKVEGLQETGGE